MFGGYSFFIPFNLLRVEPVKFGQGRETPFVAKFGHLLKNIDFYY